MEETKKRRLAAIMFTDIVGYTAIAMIAAGVWMALGLLIL